MIFGWRVNLVKLEWGQHYLFSLHSQRESISFVRLFRIPKWAIQVNTYIYPEKFFFSSLSFSLSLSLSLSHTHTHTNTEELLPTQTNKHSHIPLGWDRARFFHYFISRPVNVRLKRIVRLLIFNDFVRLFPPIFFRLCRPSKMIDPNTLIFGVYCLFMQAMDETTRRRRVSNLYIIIKKTWNIHQSILFGWRSLCVRQNVGNDEWQIQFRHRSTFWL